MGIPRLSLWLAFGSCIATSTGAENRPNFSGIWKLLQGGQPQIMIVDQNETELRVFQFLEDRLAIVKGPIDGHPHSQTADDRSCQFLARWEGDSLFFETKRDAEDSTSPVVSAGHLMRLAADGRTISVKRTGYAPRRETVREKWEKQDPLPGESFLTGFDRRLQSGDSTAGLDRIESNRLRGWIAHAFNDVPRAEEAYLAILGQQPSSDLRQEARTNLFEVYARNGMVRKALPYCKPADRPFYERLARLPETSVAQRGYARVQAARDSGGRLLLPVTAAGKDAGYMVDTGSNDSLLRMSEAVRLGLKLEPLRLRIVDGLVKFEGRLAIVPTLAVGATRLENVHFWAVPDERLAWPGVIGIDLLLRLETLRWTAKGDVEIGFPAEEKDLRKANLCFWHNDVLADVSSQGQSGMIFLLDTGTNETRLYPRFASSFLDLVSTGRPSFNELSAHGGHREFRELTVPEITLSLSGTDATLHQAAVVLERQPGEGERHGVIGMNLLNAVERVTLDLRAMRLILE